MMALNNMSLFLYSKWGMDGASSQQVLQNKSDNNNQHYGCEESVFVICFVPLELKQDDNCIWKNDRPSSVRYCRPIKFLFIKENPINTLHEYNFDTKEISNLAPTVVKFDDVTFSVTSSSMYYD